MFVVTADQHASRRTGDRVEEVLERLRVFTERSAEHVALPFQRTVGDEVQGLLYDPGVTVDLALDLQRAGPWAVGIGIGPVDRLAGDARSSSGPAFLCARDAVERARSKGVPVPLALSAAEASQQDQAEAEALLQLLAAVVRRRSPAGWEVADRIADGQMTSRAAAADLGISPQAVSQRLRTAMWSEQVAVRPLAVRLLADLDQHGHSGVHG